MKLSDNGIYTFYNEAADSYLSCEGNTLVLSGTMGSWELKSADMGYYVYVQGTDLLLDIDNAYVAAGTTVKAWQNTGYATQIWNIVGNSDGTYSFVCSTDDRYCLGFDNGQAMLQNRVEGDSRQAWKAVPVALTECKVIYGTGGIIELRLPLDITDVISEARLQQWANDLETAYHTFAELTSFTPYETIVVEGYKPCAHMAYVVSDSNVIHMDSTFVYEDLAKMALRENDWNFGALHEMGHMFDNRRPWTFEAEVMTDLKVAYVLEANGAWAAPSEFAAVDNFQGADIINAYAAFGTDFSQEYNIYACAWKFLKIKEEIGWEPFRQTFYRMQENYDQYSNATPQQMLENFISLLSSFSGRDVQSYFTADEWNTLVQKVNS